MSVKTEDREWLLDYSHHQADSNQFIVNISQNKGILSIEQFDSFNIIAILNLELH